MISVNGVSLVNCEHSEAVSALKKAGDHIEMVVMREIVQSSEEDSTTNELNSMKEGEKYSTVIQRNEKQGGQFGFSIAGGNSTTSSGDNENDNFYISKVNNPERSQSLAIGDRVLSINGHETTNISHDQAVNMINNGGNNIELTLYREKFTNGNSNSSKSIVDNTVEVSQEKWISLVEVTMLM